MGNKNFSNAVGELLVNSALDSFVGLLIAMTAIFVITFVIVAVLYKDEYTMGEIFQKYFSLVGTLIRENTKAFCVFLSVAGGVFLLGTAVGFCEGLAELAKQFTDYFFMF